MSWILLSTLHSLQYDVRLWFPKWAWSSHPSITVDRILSIYVRNVLPDLAGMCFERVDVFPDLARRTKGDINELSQGLSLVSYRNL